MISLYSGAVGSGKSYHAVVLVLEWLKKGKRVIANFPLIAPVYPLHRLFHYQRRKWEQMMSRFTFCEEITPEYLIANSVENQFMGKESSCLVVIDEAGIMFNARDWQSAGNRRSKWIKFFSQSRKFGFDFVLVAQSDRMIDRQIRGLIEYDVKHLKANNSFLFSFLSLFKITLFLYVYKWYQTRLKSNLRMSRYSKRIADRYDTMRTFDLDELVIEIDKLYAGVIVPAAVAVQLHIWREEIAKRKIEKNQYGLNHYGVGLMRG